jgi:hypothetical protein
MATKKRPVRNDSNPYPAPVPPRRPVRYALPAMYNETYLRVLPRDPYRVFSFWEITGETHKDTASPAILRLYEVSGRSGGRKQQEKPVGDIVVSDKIHSQYICVPEPGLRYRLEYGSASSGRFVPLCSSNEVTMPAARIHASRGGRKGVRAETKKLIDFSARSIAVAAAPGDSMADMPPAAVHIMTGSSEFAMGA